MQLPVPEPNEEKSWLESLSQGLSNIFESFSSKTNYYKEKSDKELQLEKMRFEIDYEEKKAKLEIEIAKRRKLIEELKAQSICQNSISPP